MSFGEQECPEKHQSHGIVSFSGVTVYRLVVDDILEALELVRHVRSMALHEG